MQKTFKWRNKANNRKLGKKLKIRPTIENKAKRMKIRPKVLNMAKIL